MREDYVLIISLLLNLTIYDEMIIERGEYWLHDRNKNKLSFKMAFEASS